MVAHSSFSNLKYSKHFSFLCYTYFKKVSLYQFSLVATVIFIGIITANPVRAPSPIPTPPPPSRSLWEPYREAFENPIANPLRAPSQTFWEPHFSHVSNFCTGSASMKSGYALFVTLFTKCFDTIVLNSYYHNTVETPFVGDVTLSRSTVRNAIYIRGIRLLVTLVLYTQQSLYCDVTWSKCSWKIKKVLCWTTGELWDKHSLSHNSDTKLWRYLRGIRFYGYHRHLFAAHV